MGCAFGAVVLLWLLWGHVVLGSTDRETQEWVSIARCRADCFRTFIPLPNTDAKCLAEQECYQCWTLCETVLFDPAAWSPLCKDTALSQHCGKGCRHACDFMDTIEPRYTSSTTGLEFSASPDVDIEDSMTLTFTWLPVDSASSAPTVASPSLVYLLLWRTETSDTWRKAVMTTNLFTSISGAHAQYVGLEFRLTAVDREGVVAEFRPEYPPAGYDMEERESDLFGNPLPAEDLEYDYDVDSAIYTDIGRPAQVVQDPDTTTLPAATTTQRTRMTTTTTATTVPTTTVPTTTTIVPTTSTTQTRPASITTAPQREVTSPDLDVEVTVDDGRLKVTVSWTASAAGSGAKDWTLSWGREVCHVTDSTGPRCRTAPETYAANIVSESTQLAYTLRHLEFNSRYWLQLTWPGQFHEEEESSSRGLFYTPACPLDSHDKYYCPLGVSETQIPLTEETSNEGTTNLVTLVGVIGGIAGIALVVLVGIGFVVLYTKSRQSKHESTDLESADPKCSNTEENVCLNTSAVSSLAKTAGRVPVRIIKDPISGIEYAVCPLACPSVSPVSESMDTPRSPTLSLKGAAHCGSPGTTPGNGECE